MDEIAAKTAKERKEKGRKNLTRCVPIRAARSASQILVPRCFQWVKRPGSGSVVAHVT